MGIFLNDLFTGVPVGSGNSASYLSKFSYFYGILFEENLFHLYIAGHPGARPSGAITWGLREMHTKIPHKNANNRIGFSWRSAYLKKKCKIPLFQ